MSLRSLLTGKSQITIGDQQFTGEHNKLASPILTHTFTVDTGKHFVVGRGETQKEAVEATQEVLSKLIIQSP